MSELPVLGITPGDPAGIGPEIAVATVTDPEMLVDATPVIYADPAIIERALKTLASDAKINVIEDPSAAGGRPDQVDVIDIGVVKKADDIVFGEVQELAGRAALKSIEMATSDAMAGKIAGIVTGPINKEAIWATGSTFLGHTELLQDLTGADKTDTMFVVGDLCTFFATRHMSLAQAIDALTPELIAASLERADRALQVFGYEQPRLAVAALNPHGGEGGHFGREEIEVITPGIEAAQNKLGKEFIGPIPADSVWHQGFQGAYDGILSLYHDQGHIATKTYDFDGTVSVTVGLPILRTSVDHGTAFNIAGTGKASPETMKSAWRAGAKFAAISPKIREEYGK